MRKPRRKPMTTEEMQALARSYLPAATAELQRLARESTSGTIRRQAAAMLKRHGISPAPEPERSE